MLALLVGAGIASWPRIMDATPQSNASTKLALGLTNCILLVMVATVTTVAVYVHFFYRPAVDPDYIDQLSTAASARLSAHAGELQREGLMLSQETWPIIEQVLIEQARHDYPLLAKSLEKEGSTYFNNVEAALLAKVKSRYHDYLVRHRQILTSEFPQHATRENVQRVLAAFETTFAELVDRYYLDHFRQEAARTEKLWRSIPPARLPDTDEPALEEQLASTAQDWLLTVSRPTTDKP